MHKCSIILLNLTYKAHRNRCLQLEYSNLAFFTLINLKDFFCLISTGNEPFLLITPRITNDTLNADIFFNIKNGLNTCSKDFIFLLIALLFFHDQPNKKKRDTGNEFRSLLHVWLFKVSYL